MHTNRHSYLVLALWSGLILISVGCQKALRSGFITQSDIWQTQPIADGVADPASSIPRLRGLHCGTLEDYIPDTNRLSHFPVRYVRVNFHFMNTTDSASNYVGEEARQFVRGLLVSANQDLQKNNPSWLPREKKLPVIPTRYQLRLTSSPDYPEAGGVYCHFDNQRFYYIHRGKNRNLYDQEVIRRYGVQRDSVLNIFIMPHHPDSIASQTYISSGVGVAVGGTIKMAGIYETSQPAWAYRGILNHEVGHVFSLAHSWLNDGCADTPLGKNPCWNRGDAPPCDTGATNNVMEYNALQNAWTPCQIGRVHQKMADERFRYRRYLHPEWCTLREDEPIRIQDTLVWRGSKDFSRHLLIAANAQLRIECRVSLPPDGQITIEPGATLILGPNARLHNACGKNWDGIISQRMGRQSGQLILEGDPIIEDNREPILP